MTVFEYLSVLVSVILGLGVTHMLAGVSKIIQARGKVTPYWVHFLWTANVLIAIFAVWWGMFWWSTLAQWNFFQFAFICAFCILLFLQAAMLYPWEFREGLNFEKHFMDNRRWLFGFLIVGWVTDVPETAYKASSGLREMPTLYLLFVGWILVLCLSAAISRNRKIHAAVAVLYFLSLTGYLTQTTLAKIAGNPV